MQKQTKSIRKTNKKHADFRFDAIALAPDFAIQAGHDCATAGDALNGLFHFHEYLEIGLCTHGCGVFIVENRKIDFVAGDMVVLGPGLLHTAMSNPGNESRWDWFFLDPPRILASRIDNLDIVDVSPFCSTLSPALHLSGAAHPRLYSLVSDLAAETAKKPVSRDTVRALLVLIMTYVHAYARGKTSPIPPVARHSSGMERIVPALKIINARFNEKLTTDDLAGACYMSARNFEKIFEKIMHETPHAYVTRFRIAQVCGALTGTRMPIARIALDCGFEGISSLNRNFKRAMKFSPREFRKNAGN